MGLFRVKQKYIFRTQLAQYLETRMLCGLWGIKRRNNLTNTKAKTFKLADVDMPLSEYPSPGAVDSDVLSAPVLQ